MVNAIGGFGEKLTTDLEHGFHGLEEEEACAQCVALRKRGPFPIFPKERKGIGFPFDPPLTGSAQQSRKRTIKVEPNTVFFENRIISAEPRMPFFLSVKSVLKIRCQPVVGLYENRKPTPSIHSFLFSSLQPREGGVLRSSRGFNRQARVRIPILSADPCLHPTAICLPGSRARAHEPVILRPALA